jgi:hypothetical protein
VGFEPTTSPLSGACLAATGYKSAALPIELQAPRRVRDSIGYEEGTHGTEYALQLKRVQATGGRGVEEAAFHVGLVFPPEE